MTQNICNIILLNHCCCNFAMFPDTFMELVWKLQLLQMFVAVLDLLVFVTVLLWLIHIWMVCCYMGILCPCRKKQMLQCATGILGLHSWKQKMRFLFISYSGWQPFKTAEMPMCQSKRRSSGSYNYPRCVNFKFQRNSWVCFICSLIGSITFVVDACFFCGVCLGGVSELIFIRCKNCLWTLSGWNLSWKGLVLMWGHVGYMLSVWFLMPCSFCDSCPQKVHILLMLINGCRTVLREILWLVDMLEMYRGHNSMPDADT